jgi:4,4'-diaponeurosporenoate glycosyltransferase
VSPASAVLVVVGLLAGRVLLHRLPVVAPRSRPLTGPTVSVIVPARNEEARLPRLLDSLADQEHPPLEVLVVDDGSTDGTAAVASRRGVPVVDAGPPPGRWLGKPWACHVGARAARGDLLVFLDADTWLAADGLGRLIEAHHDLAPDGLLSVQPFHEVVRPHEQLSAVCNTVSVLASGMAALGRKQELRVAFGPCLVTRAVDLHAVGGFGAVAHEVVEDIALARAYRQTGRQVVCLGGGDAVRFRMYPEGVGALVEGWTKNLAGGARRAAWWPRLGAVAWVAAGMAILASALTGATGLTAVAWALFSLELWWMLRRLGSFHPLAALLFPIPLVVFVLLFARSALVRGTGRPVAWRGRRLDPRGGSIS